MTVKQIKSEAKERFTVSRYKAMPAYCALFFVIINIAVVTALLCALTVTLPVYVSAILWWYGCLLVLLVLALCGPFSYSVADFYLRAYKDKNGDASLGFEGFGKYNFVRTALTFLLRFVFTFLLTCLLIFPGIIFAIKTSMSYQLMRANPKMNVFSAFKASSKIMKGHGLLYFKLIMSFFGMFLLCVVSLGAGFIFIMPYFNTCKVVFYNRELQGDSAEYASVSTDVEAQAVEQIESIETAEVEKTDESGSVVVEVSDSNASVSESTVESSAIVVEVVSENTDEKKSDVSESDGNKGKTDSTVAETAESASMEKVSDSTAKVSTADKTSETTSEIPKTAKSEDKTDASMDDIRRRIEQLRKERDKKGGRPEHSARPARPQPKVEEVKHVQPIKRETAEEVKLTQPEKKDIYDGFGPEKIEVEIVEEE